MREMKDSGVEWIGEIPKNSSLIPLKYLSSIIRGGSPRPIASFLTDEINGYNWIKIGDTKKDSKYITKTKFKIKLSGLNSTRLVKKDSLLLTNSMSFGEPYILKIDGCIHDGWVSLFDFRNVVQEYLYYCLLSKVCRVQFERLTDGGVVQNLNIDKIASVKVVLFDLTEQKQIANFLDSKCSEIDATAEDIQKEIALLEDYKKSVIIEAVTKGLNPDAEMKDSGIAWIGEIPKDWKVDKIKYHLKRNEPKNPGNAIVLSVYRDYGVIPKDSRDDNHNVTSEDTSKYKYVKKGQLVINKMKAWQGSLAVSDYDGIVSPAYFIYDFIDEEYNHKYFHYLVRSCYKEEFKRISGGIREGQWDLSPEGFSNTLVLLPSIEEQNEILDYILQKEMEIDAIIADKKRQRGILAEYKKSLIYEYVTGKKEVPVHE